MRIDVTGPKYTPTGGKKGRKKENGKMRKEKGVISDVRRCVSGCVGCLKGWHKGVV